MLSFSIWLIHNLSQNYAEVVNVPVIAESNIEGRASRSSAPVTISVRCRANGFRLVRLQKPRRPMTLFVQASDMVLKDADTYIISASGLYGYMAGMLGDGVSVEAVMHDAEFKFARENFRKVPVVPVKVISCKPQYTTVGAMRIVPDSVLVYGDPARLESIDAVFTRSIAHSELGHSVKGQVKLESPSGVRLSEDSANYSVEVSRYVELHSAVTVSCRNVPAGTKLAVYPGKVDVTVRCRFPVGTDPFASAEFYVDYREFTHSRTGRCIVRADGLGDGLIDCAIVPEVCECVFESNE